MATPRKRQDPARTLAAMPSGRPLYRIALEMLRSVGKWHAQIYEDVAKSKEIGPADPFMAAANATAQFIPYLASYIDLGGQHVLQELGQQDASDWMVRNSDAIRSVRTAAFDLCQETIDSFVVAMRGDVDKFRAESARSIARGEPTGDLVDRLANFIEEDSRWRARRIANTESARAFNTGQLLSTEDLDFVAGYRWVLDGDACPICHAIQRQCPVIPKGGIFGQNGKNETYKKILMPPAHPNCRCTVVVVFDDEIPDAWPQPVMPGENGYIQPGEQDVAAAEAGGYQSVEIGNAKSVNGFVVTLE